MPRGSFKHEDGQKAGGFGIQEGNYEILKSVVAVHQFPPNSKSGEQSDAFTALRWTMRKLDSDWNVIEEEGEIVHPVRLGLIEDMRPGRLDAKNALNMDVEPDDLGDEVDTEGNALFIESGKKTHLQWTIMEESLRKCGFKPELSGSGYAPFFEGTKLHFTTIEGKPYIASKGPKKGEEVKPTNLVCDKIQVFPGEKKTAGKTAAKADVKASSKPNGQTQTVSATAPAWDEAIGATKQVLGNLSNAFKEAVPADKEIKCEAFCKEMTRELMRQKINPKLQKLIGEVVRNEEHLIQLAMDTELFTTDGKTITFG